jgi:hypothetical protein
VTDPQPRLGRLEGALVVVLVALLCSLGARDWPAPEPAAPPRLDCGCTDDSCVMPCSGCCEGKCICKDQPTGHVHR